jgi:hypothetical protein
MVELYSLMKDEPDVRQYELKKRVFDAYGVKDIEKLLKSEEEVQQEQLEQMQGMGGEEMPPEEMMPQEGIPPQQEAVPGGFGSVVPQGRLKRCRFNHQNMILKGGDAVG